MFTRLYIFEYKFNIVEDFNTVDLKIQILASSSAGPVALGHRNIYIYIYIYIYIHLYSPEW